MDFPPARSTAGCGWLDGWMDPGKTVIVLTASIDDLFLEYYTIVRVREGEGEQVDNFPVFIEGTQCGGISRVCSVFMCGCMAGLCVRLAVCARRLRVCVSPCVLVCLPVAPSVLCGHSHA